MWDALDNALTQRKDGITSPLVGEVRGSLAASNERPEDTALAFERLSERLKYGAHADLGATQRELLSNHRDSKRSSSLGTLTGFGVGRGQSFWKIGAGVAAAAIVAFTTWHAIGSVRTSASDPFTTVRTYTTRVGQRATVTLANGSTVILAPMTTLRVSDRADDRVVELDGEAYFRVEHVPTTPFSVRVGGVTTRVLGTTFDVRRYRGDRETIVAVTTGRVAVSGPGVGPKPVTLDRGMVGRVSDSTISVSAESATQYVGWTNRQLVFHDTPLAELLETVSRWYGVRFSIPDSTLARRRVTATVDFGSRSEVLRALMLVLDASITYSDPADSLIVIQRRRDPVPATRVPRVRLDTFLNPKEMGR